MPIIRCDVVLPYLSNIPRDVAVNTFHFQTVGAGTGEGLDDLIRDFYVNNLTSPTNPLSRFISPVVSRSIEACRIKTYVVGTPGPPIADVGFSMGGPGATTSLPLEVAACLSYVASLSPGPIRRRRGRIFLGPLNTDAIQYNTNNMPTVKQTLADALATAAFKLASGSTLINAPWCVYSRVSGLASKITNGWVDDEFDTQRRRQQDATLRTTWIDIPPP